MKPQEMEAIPQACESKMRELQLRIMEDIVRRLRKNAGEVTAATEWQMKRAYELGVSKQALRQLLEQVAEELETQVDEVYDSRLANVYSADRQRYKAVGKPFIEYAENKELQQLISAVKAQTKDEFRNITQSMGFALPSGEGGKIEFHPLADYYQQTLDGAVMDIASGAFDYNTVLKRITNEMTNSGVRTVAYASGHTDRIEVAARRAVMTGFHQVVAKKAEQDMAALDTNYVEVTWHRGARPTHQVWQGKVYFWDRGFEDSLAEPPETLDNSAESGIIDEKKPRLLFMNDIDDFNAWQEEYYQYNSGASFSREENPSIFAYSGGTYEGINAVLRGNGSLERIKRCIPDFDEQKYLKLANGVSDELSKFKLHEPIELKRVVRDVDFITGKTSSLEDMKASIGSVFVEKGFTSASIIQDIQLPFGYGSKTKTVIEILAPQSTKGAYIKKISESPAEFEFLIDKNTSFLITDAGEREIEVKDFRGNLKKVNERFIRMEVVSQ